MYQLYFNGKMKYSSTQSDTHSPPGPLSEALAQPYTQSRQILTLKSQEAVKY